MVAIRRSWRRFKLNSASFGEAPLEQARNLIRDVSRGRLGSVSVVAARRLRLRSPERRSAGDCYGCSPRHLKIASMPRRLALWQDIVCDVFVELDCKSDLEDFRGEVTQSRLGEISYSRVNSSRQRVFRTPSRIARARHDYVLIALGVEGGGGVVQDGREAYIQPGEFACYDTTRPYELQG